jgi:hypothetical protein
MQMRNADADEDERMNETESLIKRLDKDDDSKILMMITSQRLSDLKNLTDQCEFISNLCT